MQLADSKFSTFKKLISYYNSYFILDRFLLTEKNTKHILGNEKKPLLVLVLHGKVNLQRINYLHKYYLEFKEWSNFLFYADYNDLNHNVVQVSTCRNYFSNELKHINVLNSIKNFSKQYDYILCVDDDTFVNMDKLKVLLEIGHFNADHIYGQVLNAKSNSTNPIFNKYSGLEFLSGGAGYLFASTRCYSRKRFINYLTRYSDVSFGLNNKKEVFKHEEMFHSQNHDHYQIDEKDICNHLTFHYVKTEEDFNRYKLLARKPIL